MGFLFYRKPSHGLGITQHGRGNASAPLFVNPQAAQAVSTALNPSRSLPLFVSPASAIATSVALNPSFNSFNPSTGAFIGGSNGAVPLLFDAAVLHVSDLAWRNNKLANYDPAVKTGWIYSDPTKTGGVTPSSALYRDGLHVDLAYWQNTVKSFNGDPLFEGRIVGANLGAESPTPEFGSFITSPCRSLWVWNRRKMTNFTAVGDTTSPAGLTWNAGNNAAYKMGQGIGFSNADGRGLVSTGSGFSNDADFFNEFVPVYSGDVQGVTESRIGSVGSYWSPTAAEYDFLVYWHGFDNGTIPQVAVTTWTKLATDPISSFTQIGQQLSGVIGNSHAAPLIGSVGGLFGQNYNQSRSTDIFHWEWGWACWDPALGSGAEDPFGVLTNRVLFEGGYRILAENGNLIDFD